MASTYVNNLRLEEMATGEQSGTWGTKTNTNLELIGQSTAWGTRAIADASTDNITIADGSADADRCLGLKLTGGGQACTVTLLPNTSSKTWFMYNATSYTLTFTCGSGANVAIPAGQTKVIATDGLGSGGVVHDLLTGVSGAGDLNVAGDVITAGTLQATGDTAAGDDAALGYTAAEGLILTGQGSTNDVTIKNDADADVIEIPTGTVNVTMAGAVDIAGALTLGSTDLAVAHGGTGAGTFAANGVIFGNGTSALGATAVGTDGNVLTSNGSGSAPTFQAAAGGGSLTFIGTQDANNSAVSMGQTGLTGFDTYMVVGSTIVPTTNGQSLFIRLGEDSYSSGSTDYRFAGGRLSDNEDTNSEGKVFSRTSTGASSIEIASGAVGHGAVGGYLNFVAYICTAPSGDSKSSIFGIGSSLDNGSPSLFRTFFWGGYLNVGSKTVNQVQIFAASNLVTGSMTVYGMKQS